MVGAFNGQVVGASSFVYYKPGMDLNLHNLRGCFRGNNGHVKSWNMIIESGEARIDPITSWRRNEGQQVWIEMQGMMNVVKSSKAISSSLSPSSSKFCPKYVGVSYMISISLLHSIMGQILR